MVQAAFTTLIKQERDRRQQQNNCFHCNDGDTRAIHDLELLRQGADSQQPLKLERFAVSSSAVQVIEAALRQDWSGLHLPVSADIS